MHPGELLFKDLKENLNFSLYYIFSAFVKKNLVFLDALRFVWGDGAWGDLKLYPCRVFFTDQYFQRFLKIKQNSQPTMLCCCLVRGDMA